MYFLRSLPVMSGGHFYLSADATIAASGETLIPFDSIKHENGDGFNSGNNRYITKKAGKYLIILQICLNVQVHEAITQAIIRVSNSYHLVKHVRRQNRDANDDQFITALVIWWLNKDDYIQGRVYNSDVATKVLASYYNNTFLNVVQLL